MKTSETTKGLSDALVKALAAISNPAKDATNPHFKSKYATLDTGLNVIREALTKAGIAFSQTTRMEGDLMMLDTRLMFGNEFIEGEYPVIKFPARQQEIGSSLTYARRYSLFAAVGVAGEDDDDGNEANVSKIEPTTKLISEEQLDELLGLITETGSDPEGFLKYMGVKNILQIKAGDFSRAKTALLKKKEVANG